MQAHTHNIYTYIYIYILCLSALLLLVTKTGIHLQYNSSPHLFTLAVQIPIFHNLFKFAAVPIYRQCIRYFESNEMVFTQRCQITSILICASTRYNEGEYDLFFIAINQVHMKDDIVKHSIHNNW